MGSVFDFGKFQDIIRAGEVLVIWMRKMTVFFFVVKWYNELMEIK